MPGAGLLALAAARLCATHCVVLRVNGTQICFELIQSLALQVPVSK
jgi:hypothetical protein